MRVATRLLVALALLLALLVIASCTAPASIAAWYVDRLGGGAIRLADSEGLLRRGQARITDAGGRWSVPIAWTIDTVGLWRGELELRLGSTPGDALRGRFRLSAGTIEGDDIDVTLPARMVSTWLPPGIALAAGGELTFAAQALRLSEHSEGRAALRWSPARVADAKAQAIDLGIVTAQLVARGERIDATLASQGGDTAITGDVRITAAGLDSDVTLTPRTSPASPLLHALAGFGVPAANGGVRLSYHGPWQAPAR